MRGNLRIWGWGYGHRGGQALKPIELEGRRDCSEEKAKAIVSQLDPARHWWVWIPPMNVRKAISGGASGLREELRRTLGQGGETEESGEEAGET